MSGVMPLPWIERPFGVKYFAVVSRSPEPSDSGMIVCTDPLPKLWVPTTIGAARVLERARDDLGRRRAALVDQDHHREVGVRLLGVGREAHVLVAHAALGVDDELAVLDELLGDLDRRRRADRLDCCAGRR